jgi:hypothetical protein
VQHFPGGFEAIAVYRFGGAEVTIGEGTSSTEDGCVVLPKLSGNGDGRGFEEKEKKLAIELLLSSLVPCRGSRPASVPSGPTPPGTPPSAARNIPHQFRHQGLPRPGRTGQDGTSRQLQRLQCRITKGCDTNSNLECNSLPNQPRRLGAKFLLLHRTHALPCTT